jgi:hypothetical protein
MLIIFFDIKMTVHKEFILADQKSIPHTTVTFYGDCVKRCEDFAPNFGGRRTGCCVTTANHLTLPFLTMEFFTKKNVTVPPPHPAYFSVFPIEDKTERPPF